MLDFLLSMVSISIVSAEPHHSTQCLLKYHTLKLLAQKNNKKTDEGLKTGTVLAIQYSDLLPNVQKHQHVSNHPVVSSACSILISLDVISYEKLDGASD